MISAISISRLSFSCQGSSTPNRLEASCLSSSMQQRTTSSATSSPHLSRMSPRLIRRKPPLASQLGFSVSRSYGTKSGSPRREMSVGTPFSPATQPRCNIEHSASVRPDMRSQVSSKRPTQRVGMELPQLWATLKAASFARMSCCWNFFRWLSVGPTNSSTKERRSRVSASSFLRRSLALLNSAFSCLNRSAAASSAAASAMPAAPPEP
mmetsp:Transcript_7260/g.12999  ORF Transcript_7260/g.12999 Transcript_7260/m.12999 type:complete len:209 (-) Transcript_7260:33-659(-)